MIVQIGVDTDENELRISGPTSEDARVRTPFLLEVFELPEWFVKLAGGGIDISDSAIAWIKNKSTSVFYKEANES